MSKCKSVKVQILKGVLGIGLIVAAVLVYPYEPLLTVVLLAASLFPLRGCPACWISDTCEIVSESKKQKADDKSGDVKPGDGGIAEG